MNGLDSRNRFGCSFSLLLLGALLFVEMFRNFGTSPVLFWHINIGPDRNAAIRPPCKHTHTHTTCMHAK